MRGSLDLNGCPGRAPGPLIDWTNVRGHTQTANGALGRAVKPYDEGINLLGRGSGIVSLEQQFLYFIWPFQIEKFRNQHQNKMLDRSVIGPKQSYRL